MINKITDAVNSSSDMYYRLLLLVDEKDEHTHFSKEIAEILNMEVVNVNLALSEKLLNQTKRQRKLYLSRSVNEIVPKGKPVLLDHIEILFDIDLGQDPLRLLESLSRNQTIVAFWRGQFKEKKLTYGEQGHPEYRTYDINDLMIIDLNEGE